MPPFFPCPCSSLDVRQETLDARVDLARLSHRRHVAQALDLLDPHARQHAGHEPGHAARGGGRGGSGHEERRYVERPKTLERRRLVERGMPLRLLRPHGFDERGAPRLRRSAPSALPRSEERTSELQSRGLISYAVFCLNK